MHVLQPFHVDNGLINKWQIIFFLSTVAFNWKDDLWRPHCKIWLLFSPLFKVAMPIYFAIVSKHCINWLYYVPQCCLASQWSCQSWKHYFSVSSQWVQWYRVVYVKGTSEWAEETVDIQPVGRCFSLEVYLKSLWLFILTWSPALHSSLSLCLFPFFSFQIPGLSLLKQNVGLAGWRERKLNSGEIAGWIKTHSELCQIPTGIYRENRGLWDKRWMVLCSADVADLNSFKMKK